MGWVRWVELSGLGALKGSKRTPELLAYLLQ